MTAACDAVSIHHNKICRTTFITSTDMFRLNTTLAITVRSSGTVFAISTQHQARVTTQLATSTSRTVRMNRLHLQHKVELDLQVLPQPVTDTAVTQCHQLIMLSTRCIVTFLAYREFFDYCVL